MSAPLTQAHIVAQAQLRATTASIVATAWDQLGQWDEDDVQPLLRTVLPFVAGAQRQSALLTDAYVAQMLGRRPLGVDPDLVTGAAVRAGTPPEDVYRRPFVTVWTALKDGRPFEAAVAAGRARASSAAAMDVQLSSRATFQAIQDADEGFYGYQRVPDGKACPHCLKIAGAYVKRADAMPLHNHCGCSLEPLTEPHRLAASLPNGVSVHEHGELGPVLTAPGDHFTTEADIA